MEHKQRHGHPLKPSYGAAQLRPLEAFSRRWLRRAIKGKPPKRNVTNAISAARRIILGGKDHGQVLPSAPREKAAAMFGRLYAKYCGERYEGMRTRWPAQRTLDQLALEAIAIALSVELAQRLDPAPASDPHFADVQVGKIVFRRAGGWLRRIEEADRVIELNRYGISRGPALGHLGRPLRQAIELLWECHCEELDTKARALGLLPIPNWTLARHGGRAVTKRGGKRRAKSGHKNPLHRPNDKIKPLNRR